MLHARNQQLHHIVGCAYLDTLLSTRGIIALTRVVNIAAAVYTTSWDCQSSLGRSFLTHLDLVSRIPPPVIRIDRGLVDCLSK